MLLIQQRVRPQGRTFNRESFLRSTEVVPRWFVGRKGADSTSTPIFSITSPLGGA
jgi:hypothetical protein